MNNTAMSPFSETILRQKYLRGDEETWEEVARRVVEAVVEPHLPELVEPIFEAIRDRKLMPGGRYLANAGQPFNQTQNCLLLEVEDNRESIADLYRRVTEGLMTGAGIGIVWSKLRGRGVPVKGMGGESTGPTAFMQSVNEIGRGIVQGGGRRAAIWAGLHWNHPDVFDFMALKDWPEHIVKAKEEDFSAFAPMDMTNISVILDDDFFAAYYDESHADHDLANTVFWTAVEKGLSTGEPGFSIDTGENAGEHLRNAPVAGHTNVLTNYGYQPIKDIAGKPTTVWTGKRWADDVIFSETSASAETLRVEMTGGRVIEAEPSHPFMVERWTGAGERRKLVSVDRVNAAGLQAGDIINVSLPEIEGREFSSTDYTLGFLYGDGSFRDGRADLTLCDEKKDLLPYISGYDSITEEDSRGYTRLYFHSGFYGHRHEGVEQFLLSPSFFAGLFDADGNFDPTQRAIRLSSIHEGFLHDVRRGLETQGILSYVSKNGVSKQWSDKQNYQLVIAADSRDRFIEMIPTKRLKPTGGKGYRRSTVKVVSITEGPTQPVYCADVKVEEHTFVAEGVVISNCTEVTSKDDNDICNLGSINMAQVETLSEFNDLVSLGTAFLLCGTLYSVVPYEEVAVTRTKNRRLGLGLMGIYEWLVARGYAYQPNSELGEWLQCYMDGSDLAAEHYANRLGISVPVKKRAIAPTGTIGILAETTTGIEPLFAVAYKRRYLKNGTWHYQYVIDATAKRLSEKYGVHPDDLETAYDLAKDPGRRLLFQEFVQQYVDHGISSTLNLPAVQDQPYSTEEFGAILLRHIEGLRGVTMYPDASRGGQPLNVCSYEEAAANEGLEFEEFGADNACVGGVCGL